MGLFTNYNSTGPGVPKKAPQKKMIFRFFDAFKNKFWTLMYINLIYVLFCIPIVTFGPATAAMTSLMRNIYLEKPQFVFHDFWAAFKKNFKQSFFIGIVDVAAISLAVYAYFFFSTNIDADNYQLYYALTMAAEVIFLMMNFFIYPQIVALDLKLPAILKNSLIFAFINLKGNLIALALFIGYIILVMFFPFIMLPLALAMPFGFLGLVVMFCCYPAIQRIIINPFYEARGERNPELPEEDDGEALFEDMGGKEAPIKFKKEKSHGKIIK